MADARGMSRRQVGLGALALGGGLAFASLPADPAAAAAPSRGAAVPRCGTGRRGRPGCCPVP